MIDIINILTIVNLSLLSILMGLRKVNTTSNKLFSLILFTAMTDFVINYLIYRGAIYHVPYIVFLNFSFLWGPCLYWYLRSMLGYNISFNLKTALHLIPQLLSWAYWSYTFFQGPDYVRNVFERRAAYDYPTGTIMLQIVILCQIFGYTINGAYLVNKHKRDSGSSITEAKIKWLRQFINLLVVLGLLCIISSILFGSADNDNIYAPLLYSVVYCKMVYNSFQSFGVFPDSSHIIHLRQEVIQYDPRALAPITQPQTIVAVHQIASSINTQDGIGALQAAPRMSAEAAEAAYKEKYSGSVLKPQQLKHYQEQLTSYLTEHEPYTNPSLTLTELASGINIPSHHLSQTINQSMEMNFADLINGYRVEKSKQLLLDPITARLTLEAIGLQSGFGSSSAFYRAFKKQTGSTPKDFLKTNK